MDCGEVVDKWFIPNMYMPIMKAQCLRYRKEFNNHTIGKQRDQYRPHGIASEMYRLSSDHGGVECGIILRQEDIIEIIKIQHQ